MNKANRLAAAFAACLLLLMLGCEQTVEPLGPFGPFDAADGEFTTTDSGLKYRITREGTGIKPAPTDGVRVHYQGQLADGVEFDSSYKRKEAFRFPFLQDAVPGWIEGLQFVAEGGMIDLIIPPDLAYANRPPAGSTIPKNATLYFTVELLEVKKTPAMRDLPGGGKPAGDGRAPEKSANPLGPFAGTDGEFLTTDSGLQYRVTRAGKGERPTKIATVKVHYEGKLSDGTVFDSSYKKDAPVEFPLNRVIRGWTEGLQIVAVGGKIDLVIPGRLAYADQPPAGSGIHRNATLYFTIELLEIVQSPK